MKSGDIFFILVLILANILILAKIDLSGKANPVVEIYRRDTIIKKLNLDGDREFTIEGKLGNMKCEIKDGKLKVISSYCPRKICMHSPAISKPGESIICVPNEIIFKIEGELEDIDAISR